MGGSGEVKNEVVVISEEGGRDVHVACETTYAAFPCIHVYNVYMCTCGHITYALYNYRIKCILAGTFMGAKNCSRK